MERKLKPLRELAELLRRDARGDRRVVHCHGVFDLLHPGHIRHFLAAKREGDILVVTITPDRFVNKGPGRPAFPEYLRAESIAALGMVDYVAINEWPTAVETIALLQPDVYTKGKEYTDASADLTGFRDEEVAVREAGGRMHFTDDITFSSSKLLNEHFGVLPVAARAYLTDFRTRFAATDIVDLLRALRGMRVLVIGDAIIDEYHSCRPIGLASKSATLSAQFLGAEQQAGGALAIANHVGSFCDKVDVITCLGATDSREDFIRSNLKPSVTPHVFLRPDGPTTVKRRYVDFRLQKLFEITFLQDRPLPQDIAAGIDGLLRETRDVYDAVLVADFGYGMFTSGTKEMLEDVKGYRALNVHTNSANMGFNAVTAFRSADYVCINELELRIASHDRFGPVDALGDPLRERLHAALLTATLGREGSATWDGRSVLHTPAFCSEVIDTIGAGDAFFSIAALCAAARMPTELVAFLGNAAGALASRVVGNRESVEFPALAKYVTTLLK
ncbi:MAG: Cytidyltransferase-related domain protein [Candidatus Peregrinibacteria bacterium Gr01-1014_25]|nr:MAG: Cytidyltransferase-related domain protein [Candidatus Peregrinibacteria bacterium Gr01-1014_25]